MGGRLMAASQSRRRCAIYTRKSSEEGLDQAFNSLDAQREACEAYIKSQAGEGWHLLRTHYDDGGVSGGTMGRPALQQLLADIRARKVDTVVVYKVDRMTRSLADFAKIVEVFDAHGVSFVSVTQAFNTTTSIGRLTLNMLLSFAQFEREVTGERIRDKIAASKKKGMWMGGFVPLGYEPQGRTLVINEAEAETVRKVFQLHLEHGNVRRVKEEADRLDLTTKRRVADDGRVYGARPLSRGYIYKLLNNQLYAGRIAPKGETYEGQHAAIIDSETWEAVQAKLAANAVDRRSGVGATEPSLLAGLLHDDHGDRFTPSHAVKNGIRYRYYVRQSRSDDDATPRCIPAREIEELVGGTIVDLLQDSARLIDELAAPLSARDQQRLLAAAKCHADRWSLMSGSSRRAFLLAVIRHVMLGEAEVRLDLERSGLRKALLGQVVEEDHGACGVVTMRIPARLLRGSREMRLVIPGSAAAIRVPKPDPVLTNAITRAHAWKDKLMSGQAASIRAIGNEQGLNESYVGRILRLAYLAPDITEAILGGWQPRDLDLQKFMADVPIIWADQRARYRFPPHA